MNINDIKNKTTTQDLINNLSKEAIKKLKDMIEDWFLIDLDGICKNLNINVPSKLKGTSALEKIQNLFKQSHRIYQKGYNSNNFVQSLNIGKIYNSINEQFKDLVKLLYKK